MKSKPCGGGPESARGVAFSSFGLNQPDRGRPRGRLAGDCLGRPGHAWEYKIVRDRATHEYRWSSHILGVVASPAFRMLGIPGAKRTTAVRAYSRCAVVRQFAGMDVTDQVDCFQVGLIRELNADGSLRGNTVRWA